MCGLMRARPQVQTLDRGVSRTIRRLLPAPVELLLRTLGVEPAVMSTSRVLLTFRQPESLLLERVPTVPNVRC